MMAPLRSVRRLLGNVALALVGASLACAQAQSYTAGDVSVVLGYDVGSSFSVTSSGIYYSYSLYGPVGNAAFSDYAFSDGASYIDAVGTGSAGAPSGGEYASVTASVVLGITNDSNHVESYSALVSTSSYSSSSINGLGNYANALSYGWAYDSMYFSSGYRSGFDQYSETGTYVDNEPFSYSTWLYADYTNGVSTGSSAYYGNLGSSGGFALGTSLEGLAYRVSVAPEATDYVYLQTLTYTADQHLVPGPNAVAPFALGLFGALRRRSRRV